MSGEGSQSVKLFDALCVAEQWFIYRSHPIVTIFAVCLRIGMVIGADTDDEGMVWEGHGVVVLGNIRERIRSAIPLKRYLTVSL